MPLKNFSFPRNLALLLWAACALALCVPAQAQTANTANTANLKGHPLFWADGITRVADLDEYKATGFNVVVVRLGWTPSQTGEFSAADLAPQRAFAQAAAQRGIMVVYSLPAAPAGFENALHLSANSPAYVALWTAWMNSAVASLSNTPNLLGWMLPDDPRGLPIFDDLGFQHWVARNYATTEILNKQWGSNYDQLSDVSIEDVDALTKIWHPQSQAQVTTVANDAQAQKQLAGDKVDPNLPFHPAALSLAAYKWDAYRDLMKTWVSGLREADGGRHLVLSGRLPDYAQLLSQPVGVDIVLPDIEPGIAENDVATHNPQAIDIARRGGKFSALPTFSVKETALLPKTAIPELLGRWISTARARGAVGAGFNSWGDLTRNPEILDAVAEKLSFSTRGRDLQLWGNPPTCTTAVLLTPLADGATIKTGQVPNQIERGLYGFGDKMVWGEPSNLVWSLRWGTAFGGVDYLSPDDLNAPLENRYITIMAPQLLSCPTEVATHLANFVYGGGTLVSDLGLGALQSGGKASAMPQQMAQLFGVPGVYDLGMASFNLQGGGYTHPLFQAWSQDIARQDNTMLTLGELGGTTAFSGSVGFSASAPVAQTLAYGPSISQNFGLTRRMLRVPVTVNDAGHGFAVFAPFQMWASWRPGNLGFDGFHGDLWARGATLAIATGAIVPFPALSIEGQTRFPEVDNRATSITLTNHDSSDQPIKLASLQTTGTGDWLWSNAIVLLSNDAQSLLASGRPTPISKADEFQSRPRPLNIYASLRPGESQALQMVPISVQNTGGGPVVARVAKMESSEVVLHVWPNSNSVGTSGPNWQPAIGGRAECRVSVYSSPDNYPMVAGSRHRVVITDYTKPVKKGYLTTEQTAVADKDGKLVFTFTGSACRIQITSASVPLVAAENEQPLVPSDNPEVKIIPDPLAPATPEKPAKGKNGKIKVGQPVTTTGVKGAPVVTEPVPQNTDPVYGGTPDHPTVTVPLIIK